MKIRWKTYKSDADKIHIFIKISRAGKRQILNIFSPL